MNCFEFRRRRLSGLRADPGEAAEHVGGCPECARFARAVEGLDGEIEAAARIEPPTELVPRILLDQRLRSRRRFLGYAAAASAAGVTLAGSYALWPRRISSGDVASVALKHIKSEPEALERGPVVPLGRVVEAFASRGGRLQGPLGEVTFLMNCPVPGGKAPHLVVHTPHGLAHLMLIPFPVVTRETAERDGMLAVALPAGHAGSLAIIAASEAIVAGVERMMSQQVAWS